VTCSSSTRRRGIRWWSGFDRYGPLASQRYRPPYGVGEPDGVGEGAAVTLGEADGFAEGEMSE
jgi:hypothetical protein